MHALTYLGEHYGQAPIPINRIAEERKMPYKFLEAILLELRNVGILGSKAGKSGGYYLLKPPSEIPLVDIIRLVDGPIAQLPCVSKKFYEPCRVCPYPEDKCNLRRFFIEVRDATLHVIEGKSLQNLMNMEPGFPVDFMI